MKRIFWMTSIALAVGLCASTAALAADAGLVQLLSSKLGVTDEQASGGAGAIFNVAKGNSSANDFAKVAKAVPGIDGMMASAPEPEGMGGMLGGASSLLGGSTPSAAGVASLPGSFSKLGMSSDKVGEFMPIVLDYVKSKGGDKTMKILQAALQ